MRETGPTGGASAARADALARIALRMSDDRSDPARPYRNVRISLGADRDGRYEWPLTLATGGPDIALAVARREIDIAALNPAAYLTMARRGTGPFTEPLPLVALAVMPSWDRMGFAIAGRTGLASLEEVREQRYPLRVSIRRNPAHATRFLIDLALEAEGFSLQDIVAWGGAIHYVDTPSDPARLRGIADGALDAVFDEGIKGWGTFALEHGLRFMSLGSAARERLAAVGWPLGLIPSARFPGLGQEVMAPSFSGWPIITREDLPDQTAYAFCRALDAVRGEIRWDSERPVTLAQVCCNTDDTALEAPLHPGAERYYREQGALVGDQQ